MAGREGAKIFIKLMEGKAFLAFVAEKKFGACASGREVVFSALNARSRILFDRKIVFIIMGFPAFSRVLEFSLAQLILKRGRIVSDEIFGF